MNIGMFKLLLCPGAGVSPAEVQRLFSAHCYNISCRKRIALADERAAIVRAMDPSMVHI